MATKEKEKEKEQGGSQALGDLANSGLFLLSLPRPYYPRFVV